MNAKQFGEKYGRKYVRKVPAWHSAGYLGKATKDEKTGVYSIPDDIPLPYSADAKVSKLPTLWYQILDAASGTCSVFASMYPKFGDGVFDRQVKDFADAGFIRICKTKSGDMFLELRQAGFEFMNKLTEAEKKDVLNKVSDLVKIGTSLFTAFVQVWPFIQ